MIVKKFTRKEMQRIREMKTFELLNNCRFSLIRGNKITIQKMKEKRNG
jgi:hypothetical protein|tara:strand:+ start:22 stop:165 length:144 start_codon:yes stop_codon:yes gene_type:complete